MSKCSAAMQSGRWTRAMAVVSRLGQVSALKRLSWGIADQAISSLQNFLLGAYIAKSLGATNLGAFSLALFAFGISLNAARALGSDPLVVRYTGPADVRWRSGAAAATGTALLTGIVSGLLCLAIGLALHHHAPASPVGGAFIALGSVLPLLTVQDSFRYAFFAVGQGARTFASDAIWTVLMITVLVASELFATTGLVWAVAVFGLTAGVAAVFSAVLARTPPDPRRTAAWLREHRDIGPRFLAENVLLGTSGQVRSVVVAATGGLAAVGAIRGAEMMIGPAVALLMGVSQVAVPEAVRAEARGRRPFRRTCLVLSSGLSGMVVAWGMAVILLFPLGFGQALLGSVWASAYPLILGVMVSAAAGCFHVGPSAGLRALGRADLTLRSQLVVTILLVTLGGVGAFFWSAPGAVWGSALASLLGVVIWWAMLLRAERFHFTASALTGAAPVGKE